MMTAKTTTLFTAMNINAGRPAPVSIMDTRLGLIPLCSFRIR